jgi:hypothetical protein
LVWSQDGWSLGKADPSPVPKWTNHRDSKLGEHTVAKKKKAAKKKTAKKKTAKKKKK